MNIINSLYSLLLEYKVEIPLIQRDYSHGRKNDSHIENVRKNLLSDIKSICDKEEYEELNLNYVYGKVKDDIFYPVDGQQRLTTLFLLALYSCENDDDLKLFTKFSYSARVTTRDFVECLIKYKKKIFENKEKLSKYIKDQFWFNYSWNYDPSILSMLNMLDYIVNFGFDKKKLYEGIFSKTKARIKFDYLNLENIGNEDDLYIKLNARGKFLTNFEIFKSKLTLRVKEIYGINDKYDEFTNRLDMKWSDFMWKKFKSSYDKVYLRFFQLYLSNQQYISKDVNNDSDDWVYDNEFIKKINKNDIDIISKTFDFVSSVNSNECINLFVKILNDSDKYLNRSLFYGITEYFNNDAETSKKTFIEWLRVVKNLCFNSQIDDSGPYLQSLSELKNLSKESHNILKALSDSKIKVGAPFTKQIKEEIIKAKIMLLSDNNYNSIVSCENEIRYFDGQINGILSLSHVSDTNDIVYFNKIRKKISLLFEDDKSMYGNLMRSALLVTYGDYRVSISNKDISTFCQDDHNESSRTPSFKRLFNEYPERVQKLIELLDENDDYKKQLNEMIKNNYYSQDQWEYCFLNYPEMFDEMKNSHMRSFIYKNEFVMVKNNLTNGTNKSLYLILLQKLLNKKNIESEYISESGEKGLRLLKVKGCEIKVNNNAFVINDNIKIDGKYMIDDIIKYIEKK